jgi:hypothetical protein
LWMVPADKLAAFRLLGDVNGDGIIDNSDLSIMQAAYGGHGPNYRYPGEPASANWNPLCDLNGDGIINIQDVTIQSSNYGKDVYTWMGWPSQDTILWSMIGGGIAAVSALIGGVALALRQ